VDYLQRVLFGHRIYLQELENVLIVPLKTATVGKIHLELRGSAHHPFSNGSTDSGEKEVFRRRRSFRISFAFTEAEDQHKNENI
jgi:hypothetical protein